MCITEKLRMQRGKKSNHQSHMRPQTHQKIALELTLIFSQLNDQSSVYEQELRTPWEAFHGHKRALEQSWGRPQCLQVETILCSFPNKTMILLTCQGTGAISHHVYGQHSYISHLNGMPCYRPEAFVCKTSWFTGLVSILPFTRMVENMYVNESYSWECSQDVDEEQSVNVCRSICTKNGLLFIVWIVN